jgi:hypothetical protein
MRRPALFRKTDLVRAARALQDAGKEVDRVEIDKTGKIVLVVRSEKTTVEDLEENEWNTL